MSGKKKKAESVGRARARFGIRLGLFLLVLIPSLLILRGMRAEVEKRIEETQGPWEFSHEQLPAWMPEDFRGRLAELAELPQQIELRSALWRDQLWEAMEASPWVDTVHALHREGDQLYFDATFVRPLVAVRSEGRDGDGGFLLVASNGFVVDSVAGDRIDEQWGIPEYYPVRGSVPGNLQGESLLTARNGLSDTDREEFRQLLSLVEVLGRENVFDRWPATIREIYADHKKDRDRFWRLLLPHGTLLDWGRAPASKLAPDLPTRDKLDNLLYVLRLWREFEGARNIELWVKAGEPLVYEHEVKPTGPTRR